MKNTFPKAEVGIGPSQLLKWIASPNSRSYPLMVLVVIYPIAIGSLQEPPVGSELPLPIWLWDSILGIAIAATLLISRVSYKRDSLNITLITWSAAAIIAGLAPLGVAALVTEVPNYIWTGVPAAIASNLGLLVIVTIFVSAATEFRRSNKLSRDLNWKLQNREAWLSEELRVRQLELVGRVFVQMQPGLAQITELLKDSKSSQAASSLVALIDQTVRPLSSEIRQPVSDEQSRVTKRRVASWSSFAASMRRKVSVAALFHPWLPLIFCMVFFTHISYLANGAVGILYLLAFLVLSLVGSGFASRWASQKQLPYLALLALNPAASLGVSLLFLEGGFLLGLQDSEGLFWFTSVGVFLVYLISGYIGLYVFGQAVINREVSEANNLLSKSVAELQLRISSLRRKVAQSVHGDIQASLQATLVRLTKKDVEPEQLVSQLLADLEQSKILLETAEILTTSPDAFVQLIKQWREVCEISLSISSEAEALVAERDELRALIFEIVRERVLNAVKHSAADEIDVSILLDKDLLKIETRNQDFSSKRSIYSGGEGTKYLDEICENWTFGFVGSDVYFKAEIRVAEIKG